MSLGQGVVVMIIDKRLRKWGEKREGGVVPWSVCMRLLVSFCVTRGHEKKPKADNWNVLGGLLLLFLVGFVVEFGLFGVGVSRRGRFVGAYVSSSQISHFTPPPQVPKSRCVSKEINMLLVWHLSRRRRRKKRRTAAAGEEEEEEEDSEWCGCLLAFVT